MDLNTERLTDMMGRYEGSGDPIDVGPFEPLAIIEQEAHLMTMEAFLAAVVEDTTPWLEATPDSDPALSYAQAGFLIGLGIGYAYAKD